MKTLIAFGFLFLFLCCNNYKSNRKLVTQNETIIDTLLIFTEKDTIKILSGDWKNTLNMYSKKDSIEINGISGELFLKTFNVNKQKIAIVIDSFSLKIYQFKNNQYLRTSKENLEGANWKIKKLDLNFDGYTDILLTEVEGAHGNSFSTAIIFDSKTNSYKHMKDFDLPNLTIDNENQLLRSKWYSSACGNSKKAIYKIENEHSVILVESINYFDKDCGGNENEEKYVLFTEKNLKDGIFKDSIKTKNGWEIFQNKIWNTTKEW